MQKPLLLRRGFLELMVLVLVFFKSISCSNYKVYFFYENRQKVVSDNILVINNFEDKKNALDLKFRVSAFI